MISFKKQPPLPSHCDDKSYRAHVALGSTDIKTLYGNPLEFYMSRAGLLEDDPGKYIFGRALHCFVLEPMLFDQYFLVAPPVKRRIKEIYERNNYMVCEVKGKTAKAFKEMEVNNPDKDVIIIPEHEQMEVLKKAEGRTIISTDEMGEIEVITKKLFSLNNFDAMLLKGKKEVAYFGEIQGVPVKCKLDLMVPIKDSDTDILIVDLKTTDKPNTPASFASSSANFFHYVQQYLYEEIMKQNGFNVIDYLFAQVSRLHWSGAGYYRHNESFREAAEQVVHKALVKFKYCAQHDVWSENEFDFNENKFDKVSEVILPNYVFYR